MLILTAYITFASRYGNGNEEPYSMVRISEGYAIFGQTNSFSGGGLGYGDLFLIKVDTMGNLLWNRVYGRYISPSTPREDYATWMIGTSDGGFLMLGYTGVDPSPSDRMHLFMIKTNSLGTVSWAKRIGVNPIAVGEIDKAWSAVEDTGGYILAGQTNTSPGADFDAIVLKVASDGSVIRWQKRLGRFKFGTDTVVAQLMFDIAKGPDGNYILVGRVEDSLTTLPSGDPEDWDIYAVKIRPNGDTVWTKRYRGQPTRTFVSGNRESAIGLTMLPSGNFVVVGYANTWESPSNNPAYRDMLVMKIRGTDGAVLWAKRVVSNGTYDLFRNAYYSNGYVFLSGELNGDAVLIKMDTLGNLIWAKRFSTPSTDIGRYAFPTNINGQQHVVFLLSSGGYAILIQLDSSGNYLRPPLCGYLTTISPTISNVSLYAIPTRDSVYNLSFSINDASVATTNGINSNNLCPLNGDYELVVGERESCKDAIVVKSSKGGLKLDVYKAGDYEIRVYDASGRSVREFNGYMGLGVYTLNVHRGLFFVEIIKDDKSLGIFKAVIM
ncbi:MAG: hypothetical protein ABIL88_04980 [candidate division WOR-3 bacterium]